MYKQLQVIEILCRGYLRILLWLFLSLLQMLYRLCQTVLPCKVGRLASEEVNNMQKCVPELLYGLEVCELQNMTLQAFDFTTEPIRVLMKLFETSNTEVKLIEEWMFFVSKFHLCSSRNVFRNFLHNYNYYNIYCYLKQYCFVSQLAEYYS